MDLLTHDQLDRMTPPERVALIAQLWESLEDGQIPLTAAQEEELDHRLLSIDQDREEGPSWEALKADMERRSS